MTPSPEYSVGLTWDEAMNLIAAATHIDTEDWHPVVRDSLHAAARKIGVALTVREAPLVQRLRDRSAETLLEAEYQRCADHHVLADELTGKATAYLDVASELERALATPVTLDPVVAQLLIDGIEVLRTAFDRRIEGFDPRTVADDLIATVLELRRPAPAEV